MKKIFANSAVFTFILAVIFGLTITSCAKQSDKATFDEAKKAMDTYSKAIDDFTKNVGTLAPAPTDAPDMLQGKMANIDAAFKKLADAKKPWDENYEKTWKAKLIETDFQPMEKQKTELEAKAKKAYDEAKKKIEDAMKVAAQAPQAEPAPAK